MKIKFPVLVGLIAARGIKKKSIATKLGISERSFYNKLTGIAPFTWEETGIIQTVFFPDKTKEELFAVSIPEDEAEPANAG